MNIGSKVRVTYINKNGIERQTIMVLSREMISEEKMSDDEVRERLKKELKELPLYSLRDKGIILAARNLLKNDPDATDIDLEEIKQTNDNKSSGGQAGGAILILAIVAVLAAIICFPLLVMLGMRGKLFLKGFYDKCRGDAYKKFVKNYTFVGIGLYAVTIILFALDKILQLQALSGPAFGLLFLGGVAYFIISLVLIKKKFLKDGEKFSLANLLKKSTETKEDEPQSPQEDSQTQEAQNDLSDSVIPESPADDPEPVVIDEPVAVNREPIPENVPAEKEEQKPAHKSFKMPITVILGICAALIIGGLIFGLISASRNQRTTGDETKATESTSEHSENTATTEPVKKMNINDYVGYWNIKENQEKELTIHNGDSDSVNFSLWYYGADAISNVFAQLQDNVATFSLAVDGAVIKGTLTFLEEAITVQITQSTLVAMPAETMEFTEQHMTSWVHSNEETESTEDFTNDFVEPTTQETNPPLKTEPYLFSAAEDSYGIYSGPSYDSDYVDILPVGTYTIVEEQYDAYNNLWGKLKSGVGWICIADGSNTGL